MIRNPAAKNLSTVGVVRPARAQVVQRYAQSTGRDVSHMVFYLAFARFKVAVIVQQIYYRYHQGLTKDEPFAPLLNVAKNLMRASLRSAETGSI